MPSLLNTYVATNYNKVQNPFSRFGTRKIAWYSIDLALTNGWDAEEVAGNMNTIVKSIQTQAELFFLGKPELTNNDSAVFMVAVAENTANDGTNIDIDSQLTNSGSKTLETVIQDAISGSTATVTQMYLVGEAFTATATDNTESDLFRS